MKTKWLLWGIAITPVIGTLSIFLAGAGHGTGLPLVIFYPIIFLFGNYSQDIIWYVILLQYPIYGLIIDINNTRKYLKYYNIILFAVHLFFILMINFL